MMKKYFLTAVFALFIGSGIYAQTPGQGVSKEWNPEQIAKRKAAQLMLDDAAMAKFMPLYQEYLEALKENRGTKEFRQNKAQLTDEEMDKMMQDRFERLVALQERITEENLKTFEGRDVEVMVTGASGKKDAATHRVTGREKTGVLVHVGVPEGESMPQVGDFVTATVTHAGRHNLIADPNPEAGQTYAVRH